MAILLNVEKAFNRIWHAGIVDKLHRMGIPIHLSKIIDSFLQNRSFKVRLDNVDSSKRAVLAGLLHGVLPPTVFIFCIFQWYPNNANVKVFLFADYFLFYAHYRNLKRTIIRLVKQLDNAPLRFIQRRVRLNAQNTVEIIFNHRRRDLNGLKLNAQKIH